jgi:hypothetical protein
LFGAGFLLFDIDRGGPVRDGARLKTALRHSAVAQNDSAPVPKVILTRWRVGTEADVDIGANWDGPTPCKYHSEM